MKEVWKKIPNHPNYMVSNLARIKSLDRTIETKTGKRRYKGKMLTPYLDKNGYMACNLPNRKYKVAQLVAMAFLGHERNGLESVVDHIDNDKTNDVLSNLQIVSNRINNSKDRVSITGYTGVAITRFGLYQASVWDKNIGKRKHVGNYQTAEEANEARQQYINENNL